MKSFTSRRFRKDVREPPGGYPPIPQTNGVL
jgi:hypothetical protein